MQRAELLIKAPKAPHFSELSSHEVEIAGTAGAGDAHFNGILTGLAAGLPLAEAHALGVLAAALSVTSLHTINKDVDRRALDTLVQTLQAPLSASVRALLDDPKTRV